MEPHRLTQEQARRVAVRAQLLDEPRPDDVLEVVEHLTLLQDDRTAAVAPSADHVLWSRLGSGYAPEETAALLAQHVLVVLDGRIRPAEDVALYRAEMAAWRDGQGLLPYQEAARTWLLDNHACRADILARLAADGPLPARALPDTCVRPWRSSGWNDARNVRRMIDAMVAAGEVAMAGRRGRDPLWDLAERVYPDALVVPLDEARRERDRRRLRALGLARPKAPRTPQEPDDVGAVGEPVAVKGVPGEWRVDPFVLGTFDAEPFVGRTVLLSPLDRLVFDRVRMAALFAFDYALEMYKPAAQRRWGYWALPVLHGDRLVGKVDATADRKAGVLRVDAVHEDEAFDADLTAAVQEQVEDLARWLDLEPLHAR
ncbi:DNA glycosylase AlkZ-like family protein [Cellulomonas marina]|uniref:Winged helix DNA-binding domain-containing protein n=1 Tax=Cellulomonas marina TaxID=988821 RepID=A0A1I0Y501_9CELL|nr:crosslink repair DNA glycosylase YcaQ family protein [Cellulomonas marina]GIG29797.1 hypothetical protein Cma02nite_23970 [Cellulomonas marina]SFB08292.1 hypothetical protein SAMN05421867_106180 [Cellulomonas marina]